MSKGRLELVIFWAISVWRSCSLLWCWAAALLSQLLFLCSCSSFFGRCSPLSFYWLLPNILPQQTWMESWDRIWLGVLQASAEAADLCRWMDREGATPACRAHSLSHGGFSLLHPVFPDGIKLNNQIMLWITKSGLVSRHRMKHLKNYPCVSSGMQTPAGGLRLCVGRKLFSLCLGSFRLESAFSFQVLCWRQWGTGTSVKDDL